MLLVFDDFTYYSIHSCLANVIMFGRNCPSKELTLLYLSKVETFLRHFNFNLQFRRLISRMLRKLKNEIDASSTVCPGY